MEPFEQYTSQPPLTVPAPAPQALRGQRQNRRLAGILVVLLILLAALLYLYWVLTKPPTPTRVASSKGITPLFSLYGFGRDRFSNPNGVAFDQRGNIYVADTGNHRIVVFDSRGRYLFRFGSEKAKHRTERFKKGALLYPLNTAIAPNGDIYVASMMASRISIFNSRGKFKKELYMDRPIQLLIKKQRLYITTPGQVWVATLKGKVLQKWGSKGRGVRQFEYPNGIDLDKKGNIFVSDSQNMRIQILNKKGELVGGAGSPPKDLNDAERLFGLGVGLVLDEQERVYVVDGLHHAIRVFTHDGEDLGEYGDQGEAEGQFNYPTGIAYAGGSIFAVADKWNDRVQVIRITPKLSKTEAESVARQRPWKIAALLVGLLLLILLLLLLRRYLLRQRKAQPGEVASKSQGYPL